MSGVSLLNEYFCAMFWPHAFYTPTYSNAANAVP